MRKEKIFYIFIIVVLILCVVFFGKDMFGLFKIGASYLATTTETRVSNREVLKSIKYSSTDNIVEHKEDIFEKLKEYNNNLIANKEEVSDELFEIKNIHKIKDYYPDYQKYCIAKYKLFNIVEDIPKLRNSTRSLSNEQLKNYFKNNLEYIENIYGITEREQFIDFAKSLSFFNDKEISSASVRISSIINDADDFTLMFKLVLYNNNNELKEYHINSYYYKVGENQIPPYINISEPKVFS